jgi:hypothetical protein
MSEGLGFFEYVALGLWGLLEIGFIVGVCMRFRKDPRYDRRRAIAGAIGLVLVLVVVLWAHRNGF